MSQVPCPQSISANPHWVGTCRPKARIPWAREPSNGSFVLVHVPGRMSGMHASVITVILSIGKRLGPRGAIKR